MNKSYVFALALMLAGCAGIDWGSRVGTYTFDSAKREFGPADACNPLSDGGQVCSWTKSHGRNWIDKRILAFDKDGRLVSGTEKRF